MRSMLSTVRSAKLNTPCKALVDRDPIQQNLRVLAAQTPCEHRRQLTRRSALRDRHTRHFSQRIRDATTCRCSISSDVTTLTLAGD